MDTHAMAHQECYAALARLIDRQNLGTNAKLAKALNITNKQAKALLEGNLANITQDDLIKFTSDLILQRMNNGASKKT